MANVIFTGPAQKPRDPSGGLGGAFAKLGPAFGQAIQQQNQLKRLQEAIAAGTSPVAPTSIAPFDGGVFQDFPGRSNVPTQINTQAVIQNLVKDAGGLQAFLGNHDGLLKALDAIGGGGGLDSATHARLFGSRPTPQNVTSETTQQQLPVQADITPGRTPEKNAQIKELDKINKRIEDIKTRNTESDDPFIKSFNKRIGSISSEEGKQKVADRILVNLESKAEDARKSLGEQAIDKETGDINIGLKQGIAPKAKEQRVNAPPSAPEDAEIAELRNDEMRGREALAHKGTPGAARLGKPALASLDGLIERGAEAKKRIQTLIDQKRARLEPEKFTDSIRTQLFREGVTSLAQFNNLDPVDKSVVIDNINERLKAKDTKSEINGPVSVMGEDGKLHTVMIASTFDPENIDSIKTRYMEVKEDGKGGFTMVRFQPTSGEEIGLTRKSFDKAQQRLGQVRDAKAQLKNLSKSLNEIPDDKLRATIGKFTGVSDFITQGISGLDGLATNLTGSSRIFNAFSSTAAGKRFLDTAGKRSQIMAKYIVTLYEVAVAINRGGGQSLGEKDIVFMKKALDAGSATSLKNSIIGLADSLQVEEESIAASDEKGRLKVSPRIFKEKENTNFEKRGEELFGGSK